MNLFDMHTHLPSERSPIWPAWTPDAVLARMDSFGIDRAVVMTLDGLAYDPARGNEVLQKACADHTGRLFPAGTVDPRRPDAADEVRRCAERGFRAIKLHPWMQGFSPLESYMAPLAETAAECGLPLLVHDGSPPYSSPLQLAHLASHHPELTVVLAHGGLFDLWEDAVAAACRYPNVHITMCGTAPLSIFRRIIQLVPCDKLSLGTDTGFGDPDLARHRVAVHRALLAELPEDTVLALASGNAERLLGLS